MLMSKQKLMKVKMTVMMMMMMMVLNMASMKTRLVVRLLMMKI